MVKRRNNPMVGGELWVSYLRCSHDREGLYNSAHLNAPNASRSPYSIDPIMQYYPYRYIPGAPGRIQPTSVGTSFRDGSVTHESVETLSETPTTVHVARYLRTVNPIHTTGMR